MRRAIQQTVGLHVRHRLGSSSRHILHPARCDRRVVRHLSSGASHGSSRRRKVWTLAAFAAGLFLPTVWRVIKKAKGTDDDENRKLNPVTFTPYVLVSKEPVSSTSAIFTLRHERGSTSAQQQQLPETQTPWPQRAIWSVQIKQPQLQIARSYTPLPPLPTSTLSESADPTSTAAPYNPTAGTGLDEIRLLIRREREGEVSGYLHNLPVGSTVELRGPHIEYEIADDVENIVFLAGGTGIAPALQAAHCIVGKAEDTTHKSVMGKPQIHVLWANRRRDDCLGRDNASSIPEEDDMSARSSGSFLEKLASYFWRSDRPSPASSQTGTPKDLSGHLSQSHSPFPAAASPSSSPPSHRSPSSQNPAPPSQIVQLLQSLQSRFPSQVTASYFVDEEGSYITRDVLARYIARKPSSPPSSSLSLPPSLDDEMKQVDEMKKEQYQMTQKNLEDSMIRWKPANRDSLLEKEKANSSTLRGAVEEKEQEQNDDAMKNKKRTKKRTKGTKGLILLSGPDGFVALYAGPKNMDQQQHREHRQHRQQHRQQQQRPQQQQRQEDREGQQSQSTQKVLSLGRGVGEGVGEGEGGGDNGAATAVCGGILGAMHTQLLTQERRGKSGMRKEEEEEKKEKEKEKEGEGWIVHRL